METARTEVRKYKHGSTIEVGVWGGEGEGEGGPC